jgi:8-amino-7-oxononanoate synthase
MVVTDGVFSMDGDVAPLRELASALPGSHEASLFVDDAHGFGVLGANRAWIGRGGGASVHRTCPS